MKTAAEVELEFYDKFFLERDLEPYPVQEEAFERIFRGESVLVTVPTGTGKTMMAKAGLMLALQTGRTAVYTTPLRALTEEKYRELCDDFGADNVGFATGDYKVNPEAPIQVLVAEILWNRIYADQDTRPADIVVMDEGHYFNDFERGYVWEQSIIGLHPDSQLIILSATIGQPQAFCQWVYVTRKQPMALVRSDERKVPLFHEFREQYLVEVVKELYAAGDYPAIIFTFGRRLCFERARLLRSCPRFVTKDEMKEIEARVDAVLLPVGIGPDLKRLLMHGVGVHHAGILPAYRRLVEELTADRLLKFVVTTETIAAGINLPAKRVIFPELRKYIKRQARLLVPAEYHQMAGRAGRPQFDTEGVSLVLAPEGVVQEFRKEVRDEQKRGYTVDEARIKKKYYARAKSEAKARKDVTWDEEAFSKLVAGEPAELKSKTRITAEQILAIGLPDLAQEALPGEAILAREAAQAAAAEAARAAAEAEAAEDGLSAGISMGSEAAPSALEAQLKAKLEAPQASAAPAAAAEAGPAGTPGAAAGGAATPDPGSGTAAEAGPAGAQPAAEAAAEAGPAGSPGAAGEAAALPPRPDFSARPPVREEAPGAPRRLNIRTVIDHLLLPDGMKIDAHRRLAQITANLQALGVLDAQGRQIDGKVIGKLRGVDGPFVWYALKNHEFDYPGARELVELLVEHDVIHNIFEKKARAARRQIILARLREQRQDNPQLSFEDVEAEYLAENPPEPSQAERIHQAFTAKLVHPELHGGKAQKWVWAEIEDEDLTFTDYVQAHDLGMEEGSLFTYLARVMKTARMLHEVVGLEHFAQLELRIRHKLAVIDERVMEGLW